MAFFNFEETYRFGSAVNRDSPAPVCFVVHHSLPGPSNQIGRSATLVLYALDSPAYRSRHGSGVPTGNAVHT